MRSAERFESMFTRQEIQRLRESSRVAEKYQKIMQENLAAATAEAALMFIQIFGKDGVIAILKALRFFTDLPGMAIKKTQPYLIDKAISLVRKYLGIDVPFTGEQFIDFAMNFFPNEWVIMAIDGLIDLLKNMSNEEYKKVIDQQSEENELENLPEPEPAHSEPLPDSGQLDLPFPKRKLSMGESKLWRAIKRPVK